MRNRYLTFFVVLCFLSKCTATTVIVAVTPTGIVVGCDGKPVNTGGSGKAVKVFLLKQRFIVGNIDTETAEATDTGRVLYDFPRWISHIDKKASSRVSVTELSSIIKNDIPSTFNFLIEPIKARQITKENAARHGLDPDAYIVEYVVAGYEQGSAFVHWITLLPDWDNHTVKNPIDVPLYQEQGKRADSYIRPLGRHAGIDAIQIADSDEQRALAKRIPIEFGIMLKQGTFTLKQASNAVRSILAIEIKAEPCYVGFPLTIITVPKTGKGWVKTYKTDVSTLSRLPKANGAKQKNNPRSSPLPN